MRTRPTAALLALVVALPCCKTHSDSLTEARQMVARGDYVSAIDDINRALGLDNSLELPGKWKSETALTILERATLLNALNDYELSARDMSAAEAELEYFDLSRDTVGNIGSYIYSDSAEVYRAVPMEQIGINALNVVNYLAMGNLQGARVEARRLTVVKEYLANIDPKLAFAPFASYLAGFTFEQLGEAEEAMRYYDEAIQAHAYQSLRGPVATLAGKTPYRGKMIDEFLAQAGGGAPEEGDGGDLLVIVGVGRAPYKVPERIAVGAAIGIAAAYLTVSTAVLEKSATKVIVYPKLVPSGSPPRTLTLSVTGKPVPLELAANIGAQTTEEYNRLEPKIIAAALTRMVARAASSEGVRAVVRNYTGGSGLLAALGVEGLLVALDRPDTRSWSFLPDKVFVSRVRLPPGSHRVTVQSSGAIRDTWNREVEITKDGFQVVSILDLR